MSVGGGMPLTLAWLTVSTVSSKMCNALEVVEER